MDNYERCVALTARDYNGMAQDLQVASRSFNNSKSVDAYEKSYIGRVAGFEALKIDAGKQIAAAGGSSITMDTTGSLIDYVPVSTTGTDNRRQQITVSSTTSVVAGDAFTVAGVEAVHHITKDSTNQLKTFRVISVDSGTTMTISPPMISGGGGTDAELQYQNITTSSTSATAALTFLNANATGANPFWCKESLVLMPGRYAVPDNQGVDVLRGTTDQGIEVVMGKKFDNSTFVSTYTLDVFYGVTNLNPEMNGIILFNQ